MKLIPLSTQGAKNKGKYFAKVSDEDFDFINQWRWTACPRSNNVYVQRRYIPEGGDKKIQVQMHRVLLGVTDSNIIIDHKDGDGLNNQRDNIRIATRTQNACNAKKDRGTSKYIGVSWHTESGKWLSKVKIYGKAHYVGYFTDEKEAAIKRDIKAKELHGEFAKLNFPEL